MSDENNNTSAEGTPAADLPAHEEKRQVHRFRVRWHADVVFPDHSTHQGIINDISTKGASVFLSENLLTEEAMLHIHVPPLSLTSEAHVIAVRGKSVYSVFDSDKQQYRIAFVFAQFQHGSDEAYLSERLSKYQQEIHEPAHYNLVEL